MNCEFQKLQKQIKAFVKEREWEQFHNAKDLALALSIEAAELNECFTPEIPSSFEVPDDRHEIVLVPYGATTLRLTVFPTIP